MSETERTVRAHEQTIQPLQRIVTVGCDGDYCPDLPALAAAATLPSLGRPLAQWQSRRGGRCLATIEMGRVHPRSLFARFAFTRDELRSASARWTAARHQGPAAKPSEMRTYVHELTHYHQLVTTPYGLFLQYCKKLQNEATISLVNTLLAAGFPVIPPLLVNIIPLTSKMPTGVADEIRRCLSGWLNIEVLIAALDGNRARRMDLSEMLITFEKKAEKGAKPIIPPMLYWQRTFFLVQDSLADHITRVNHEARERRNPDPVYPGNIDRSAITAALSALPSDFDRAIEGSEFGLSMLAGYRWDVDGIVESHATAAEFWESDATYDSFTAWALANDDPDLGIYHNCLVLGLEAIGTRKLQSFLASYMALCEIALFAPLLPWHAELRASSPSFDQLLPAVRFERLLGSAAKIKPMQSPRDHGRFVLDLCKDLGWVHPTQIIRSAVDELQAVSDPITVVYLQAQRWRAQMRSTTFIGIDPFLFDPSPAAEQWRYFFDFVIIDYKDRTTYHPDKNFLETMTTRYLSMLGLETLMRRDSLTLEAPYGKSTRESEWMTGLLRGRFRDLFGRDFPDLNVV